MTSPSEQATVVPTQSMDPTTSKQTAQISVCICTLKRPDLLRRTLASLEDQQTGGLFTYSVVVADNDVAESARQAVAEFSAAARLPVTYCVEPRQNIALARNKAIESATGDWIAFIDDDEFPAPDWLLNLFKTCAAYQADGALGPVKPYFDTEPPKWVKKGGFFDRPTHATGYKVTWEQSRTGNVLFRKDILNDLETPFRSEFATAGEDMDFFRRAMNHGCSFVWCNEAVAYEVVPSSRCTRTYLLRRALLRGSNFPKHPENRFRNVTKSLIAVPCYALILPILLVLGQHVFLRYLIKVLDHASRLFAFLGFTLVTQRQT
jgi:glycosyltransferase involved in cell wall biosynthesis